MAALVGATIIRERKALLLNNDCGDFDSGRMFYRASLGCRVVVRAWPIVRLRLPKGAAEKLFQACLPDFLKVVDDLVADDHQNLIKA